MGSGRWDNDIYDRQKRIRQSTGQDAFAYDRGLRSKSNREWESNPLLDPRGINGVRESRDSDEHPTSRAIGVVFDVTGSMGAIPRTLQEKLGKLMDLIKEKGGLEHPHIMVGAVGDAYTDRVPFQIGQFESDNRIDEQLRLFFLEGNGGGQRHESYGLAFYMAGWKTSIDCWEKRREKGYLFVIGDEMPHPLTTREQLLAIFGDGLEKDLSIQELIAAASEKYEVFYIIASGGSHGMEPEIEKTWRALLGEQVLRLDDPSMVCELIASTIALAQGVIDPANLAESMGLDQKTVETVTEALKPYAKRKAATKPVDNNQPKKTGRI